MYNLRENFADKVRERAKPCQEGVRKRFPIGGGFMWPQEELVKTII